jgi:hypothetical protein
MFDTLVSPSTNTLDGGASKWSVCPQLTMSTG